MKKVIQLISLLAFSLTIQSQTHISYVIHGHEDDWELFMSSKVIVNMSSGGKVVFITLTAGDGGAGAMGTNISYFLVRERGSVYSSKYAADITGGIISDTPSLVRVTINGHSIVKYSYNNNKAINYFLRLPDGNGNGNGYSGTGFKSLHKLYDHTITSISSVDGMATYTSWNDLTNTILGIIRAEKGLDNQAWIEVPSLDSTNSNTSLNNSSDHQDHYYSSKAAQDAVKDSLWVGINQYIDYFSSNLTANLSVSDQENAAAIFGISDLAIVEGGYTVISHNAHKVWLPMDYFSVKRVPVGNAGFAFLGLTEIPMIVSLTDPAFAEKDISMLISPFETGEITTLILDLSGKKIFEINTQIKEKEPIVITVKSGIKTRGTYIIKNILNNKYVESRKINIQ